MHFIDLQRFLPQLKPFRLNQNNITAAWANRTETGKTYLFHWLVKHGLIWGGGDNLIDATVTFANDSSICVCFSSHFVIACYRIGLRFWIAVPTPPEQKGRCSIGKSGLKISTPGLFLILSHARPIWVGGWKQDCVQIKSISDSWVVFNPAVSHAWVARINPSIWGETSGQSELDWTWHSWHWEEQQTEVDWCWSSLWMKANKRPPVLYHWKRVRIQCLLPPNFHWTIYTIPDMYQNTPYLREAIMCQLCSFFKHCSNGGGGSNPCWKILLQIFYYSKGLFGNIKLTWKTFLGQKCLKLRVKLSKF